MWHWSIFKFHSIGFCFCCCWFVWIDSWLWSLFGLECEKLSNKYNECSIYRSTRFIYFIYFLKKKKRKVFLNRFYSNKSIVRSSCLCIFCYNGNFVNNWFMSNIDGSFVFCCIDVNVHHRFFFLFNFDFEEHRTFCFSILEIFLSATIGLFAGKGKTSHIGYLSSAWWLALVALIIAFITAIALLILSFYILPPSTSSTTTTINEQNKT